MENGERTFRKELQLARKQLEETAEAAARPSRELEDYSVSSTMASGMKGPATSNITSKQKPAKSEKQGWLNLRTVSGKPARTAWVRRWFYVKNGIFGWLVQGSRSGGVEESERIGVLLCGVRPASQEERRFCFEVKTKDTTIVLQAESQPELADWMNTFEIAKQKALEDPSSTDSPVTTAPRALDPAFAISPPSAPEFAASAADAGMQQSWDDYSIGNNDRSLTLPPEVGSFGHRGSFDVTSNRRPSGLDKESESGRDPATRIMQKLDIHRKAIGSQGNPSSPSLGSFPASKAGVGGIASLISASHMVLPVGPGALPDLQPSDTQTSRNVNAIRSLAASTLAPATLANPPTQTNLSSTAVIVNGERGIGVGRADITGGMPSGMLANMWGSSNWGYINRLERGEVKPTKEVTKTATAGQTSLASASEFPANNVGTATGEQQRHSSLIDKQKAATSIRDPSPGHRKTISLGGDAADLQRSIITPQAFPIYYPLQLKVQDAQFRLLFPNVKVEEKVVLVFRATWNPTDQQEFPGRVYVTENDIFFYSNHLGLVLITGLSLGSILEVTAAPGRECDFLFLHLKEESNQPGFTRVTVKTFLEPLKLLQRRLNFLVENYNSDEPYNLENIMKVLIKLEQEEDVKSPSMESWEESAGTTTEAMRRTSSQRAVRDLRTSVLIDQGLLGQGKRFGDTKEATRFKLPSQPVVYVPRGVSNVAVEKQFDISPKALFHVMFGDRSAVWQLLYHERRAQRIKQGPWTSLEHNHLRRTFEYTIEYLGTFRKICYADIVDNQIIDVLNDHLCYVVTDRKTPWHLPYHHSYTLVSKIVITHVAKSRCKLAIYTKIEWASIPVFARGIIEQKALSDLALDALDLADVITDQVRKLGARSRTKKAIQIFGQIGQLTQTTEFGPIDAKPGSQTRRSMGRKSLTFLILENAGSIVQDIIGSILMWIGALMRWIWKTGNANTIILLILAVSALTNVFFSTRETSQWWKERNAGRFMTQLGIGPDLVMSKAVHVRELELATQVNSNLIGDIQGAWYVGFCCSCSNTHMHHSFQTFQTVTSISHPSSSSTPTARRLRRTRQQLGNYRHDLLVAMRVVNSIEQEVLQAEWEDWVLGETGRCVQMTAIMEKENSTQADGMMATKSRLEEYCASCNEAQSRVTARRRGFA